MNSGYYEGAEVKFVEGLPEGKMLVLLAVNSESDALSILFIRKDLSYEFMPIPDGLLKENHTNTVQALQDNLQEWLTEDMIPTSFRRNDVVISQGFRERNVSGKLGSATRYFGMGHGATDLGLIDNNKYVTNT